MNPTSFHTDAKMMDGIAQWEWDPAGSLDAEPAEHRVDRAVVRVEEPPPHEGDGDPARYHGKDVDAAKSSFL